MASAYRRRLRHMLSAMTTATELHTQTLRIEGMHCAACVRRVERALVKVDGVSEASADFIAGRAIIEVQGALDSAAVDAAISGAGYELVDEQEEEAAGDAVDIRPQLSRALPALIFGWGMFFAMQANRWGEFGWNADLVFPLFFAITTPTLAWGVWPMARRAALAASRRTTDMDTLIVLGVAAAWGYSTVAALAPAALDGAGRVARRFLRHRADHRRLRQPRSRPGVEGSASCGGGSDAAVGTRSANRSRG